MDERLVEIHCTHPSLQFNAAEITALFICLDLYADDNVEEGELSIALLNRQEISRLHGDFMGDPSPTDVITFSGDSEDDFAGEICICVDIAREVSLRENLSFSEEMTLYLIHGWLHLAGYLDQQAQAMTAMRKAEERTMHLIKKHNKMPFFSLLPEPESP